MKEEHIFWCNSRVDIKEIDENWSCTKERINERGPFILFFVFPSVTQRNEDVGFHFFIFDVNRGNWEVG